MLACLSLFVLWGSCQLPAFTGLSFFCYFLFYNHWAFYFRVLFVSIWCCLPCCFFNCFDYVLDCFFYIYFSFQGYLQGYQFIESKHLNNRWKSLYSTGNLQQNARFHEWPTVPFMEPCGGPSKATPPFFIFEASTRSISTNLVH